MARSKTKVSNGLSIQGSPNPGGLYIQGSGSIPLPLNTSTPSPSGVLGAATSTPNNLPAQQTQAPAAPANDQARSVINQNFDEITSNLRGRSDILRAQSGQLADVVGRQYGTNKSLLDTSLEQGRSNIDRSREKVRLRGSETLKDLATNIRSAFDAGNIRLGTAGASDSSATGQMAYALAKLQNQNRSDILMQGNEQLGDLDFEENNLMTDYNSQLAALKEDKESRLTELSIDFQNKINAINDELVNANVSRREALTNLRTDVANEALANIAQLDAEISSFTEEMTNRANARLGEINAARLSATASDFAPTTQLGQVNSGLRMGPSASALGELSFFRPTSRDEE